MILERIYTPHGTYGQLEGLQTLERPWVNNEVNISCVPEGKYICKRVDSPKHGITFEVTDVKGRTYINIHIANEVHELLGCIALGTILNRTSESVKLVNSRIAFERFMNNLSGKNQFELEIKEYEPKKHTVKKSNDRSGN